MHNTKTSIRFRFYTHTARSVPNPFFLSLPFYAKNHNVTYRLHYYVIIPDKSYLLFFQVHISIYLYHHSTLCVCFLLTYYIMPILVQDQQSKLKNSAISHSFCPPSKTCVKPLLYLYIYNILPS